MRFIIGLLLLAFILPAGAIPYNISEDVSYCKIGIDTGSSIMFITAHFNQNTGLWEVWLGTQDYMGSQWLPLTYEGDKNGIVAISVPP